MAIIAWELSDFFVAAELLKLKSVDSKDSNSDSRLLLPLQDLDAACPQQTA